MFFRIRILNYVCMSVFSRLQNSSQQRYNIMIYQQDVLLMNVLDC